MSTLQEFRNLLNTYKTAKNDYETKLDEFEKTLNQVVVNHQTANGDDIITNIDGKVTTAEGVVMNTLDSTNTTSLQDTLSAGDTNYESSAIFQGGSYSNTFVQVGLGHLPYVGASKLNSDVYNMETPVVLDRDDNNGCTENDLYRCDSYAKMENKNYYGLGASDSSCNCYVMDTIPTTKPEPTVNIPLDITRFGESVSYLAILFDGTLCTLKQEIYSQNFANAYEYEDNGENINEVIDGLKLNDCNKFTGSGINTIEILNMNCQ